MNTFRKIFSIVFMLFVSSNFIYSQSEEREQEKTFLFQGLVFDAESLQLFSGVSVLINQNKQMESDSLGIFYFSVSLGDTITFYIGKEKNCSFIVPNNLRAERYTMAVELDKNQKEKSEIYFSATKQKMPIRAKKPVPKEEGQREQLLETKTILSVNNVNADIIKYFEAIGYKKQSKEEKKESIIDISEKTLSFFEKEIKKASEKELEETIKNNISKRDYK